MNAKSDNSWPTIQDRMEEMQNLRGWFVNSYAQIEYLLGAFILVSISMDEYSDLGDQVPHRASGRAKRVKQIVELRGRLSAYGPLLHHILDKFLKREQIRNLLAHGFCEYVFTIDGEYAFRFTKWHREKARPGENLRMQRDFNLKQLEAEIAELMAVAKEVLRNIGNIEAEFGLPGVK